MFKLYLDPGHGRMDPGAIGNGMQEKEITLNISHSIRNLLASEISWKTIMKACKLK
ncbi:N-acetylmuramoyl-L-alanine amidase [Bacillus subtilis]|uniref:N-acetylmuramoyl-L-alanine amidase n=1 Tax=Bacillus sp. seq1 TaxID=2567943 RepID=UPI0005ADD862|nr:MULTISPECIES: N-acetylmuramoyl-L-alanine amidase [Bacillus]KIN28443.1 N-acetylmuramoyl-L-alanine amidase [Bacillus subtilis]KIN40628.1 N-acetylmuramoyl-L-alanine amidase [Bacillus subtilis]KIN41945.1 N-acetylmuramoyl-L-alanine amidase [Bacillus subtilis]MCB4341677.1 Sporulation-specific N-acetylmuramoyl-L-alanine amidase [Bacillus subtilis]MEC0323573.1 N-acetylmuramoyl-L-alanine amidase [Bacillus subtilis]